MSGGRAKAFASNVFASLDAEPLTAHKQFLANRISTAFHLGFAALADRCESVGAEEGWWQVCSGIDW